MTFPPGAEATELGDASCRIRRQPAPEPRGRDTHGGPWGRLEELGLGLTAAVASSSAFGAMESVGCVLAWGRAGGWGHPVPPAPSFPAKSATLGKRTSFFF